MIDLIVSNWIYRLVILIAVFAAVTVVAVFLVNYVSNRIAVHRGLKTIKDTDVLGRSAVLTNRTKETAWSRIVERIESGGLNLDDTRNSELQELMRAAGYDASHSVRIYTLARICMIFVLPGLYLAYAFLIASEPPSLLVLYLVCATLALLGIYLPLLFVRLKARGRQRAILNAFPDSLDLMLVCVEAGLGLEAALDRVSRESATTHPQIAALFSETVLLMRAGASRDDAMRKLAYNAGIDEVRSFTTLMIQSDKLGTSIATTLRVYSAEMREARKLRAEEKAHRLPVLISIPLVVCMLPTMIGVLALPAIVLTIRDVLPGLAGGG
ncbi:type II secretion system F family protein [Erythrobacter sp. MTPC3]|uniref:type II secretion system F family protein n=1 Tax=Erythrobacter sp. MTPC3 TaxID=3056564 RepID=UPI0036F2068A